MTLGSAISVILLSFILLILGGSFYAVGASLEGYETRARAIHLDKSIMADLKRHPHGTIEGSQLIIGDVVYSEDSGRIIRLRNNKRFFMANSRFNVGITGNYLIVEAPDINFMRKYRQN